MRARRAAAALLGAALALAAGRADAETLITEMSTDIVSISSNFSGSRPAIFGVIERDAQTVSRAGKYQVIVVVKGPPQNLYVQRKERTFGIWINGSGERFTALPSYYGVFSSESARPLLDEGGAARSLSLDDLGDGDGARDVFRAAVVNQRSASGLYLQEIGAVNMMTEEFFRTEVPLPGIVEDGIYEVTVYLFADGVRLDEKEMNFVVAKAGAEQKLYDLARSKPLVYGLGVVVLALVTGYAGGILFRRS